jgi:hypothetical protein
MSALEDGLKALDSMVDEAVKVPRPPRVLHLSKPLYEWAVRKFGSPKAAAGRLGYGRLEEVKHI